LTNKKQNIARGRDVLLLQQPISVRPKVSETRRKVRDVLCKIKKDPHYFD